MSGSIAHEENSQAQAHPADPPSHSPGHHSSHPTPTTVQTQALYVFAMALLLGSAILVATVWFSFQEIKGAIDQKILTSNALVCIPSNSSNNTTSSPPGSAATVPKTNPDSGAPTTGSATDTASLPTVDLASRPYEGAENAPVVIYEIADYQCPYCVQAYPTVKKLLQTHPEDVRIIFVHYPLTSLHPYAQKAAEAAECANDQGKFTQYSNMLFEKNKLAVSDLKAQAKELGLDSTKFDSCLDSGEKVPLIAAFSQMVSQNGISSTPTFILNGDTLADHSEQGFEAAIDAVLNPPRAKIDTTGRPTLGNPNAPVQIIEFSDFQCPYCERGYQTIKQVEANYPDKVKITFMHFPLSFHPLAQKAAEAAECANDQGKFWEYHDKLFTDRKLELADLKAQAKELGMDSAKFDKCLDSGEKAAVISKDQALGTANGIQGTPGFFINGYPLLGAYPYADFQRIIDKELANPGGKAS